MSQHLSISSRFCFVFCFMLFFVFCVNASPEKSNLSQASASAAPLEGHVLSIEQGGGYSFIEVQLASSDIIFLASANLSNDIKAGSTITWESAQLAENYYSHALDRTFSQLYMVTFKQAQVDTGYIESIQTVGANTYLGVKSQQEQVMLVLNNNQTKAEFLQGTKIEWLLAGSQPYIVTSNTSEAGPLVVEWVQIASNGRQSN